MERAERGIIVAGRLADGRISTALAELSETIDYPILAEPTSQMRFGAHDRGAVIASYDVIARCRPEGLAPDLVLRFGDMPTSKALRTWLAETGVDQIVIDPPGRWNEPTRRAGAFVRAEAHSVVAGLCSRVALGERGWRGRWVDAERAAQAAIDVSTAEEVGLSEPSIQRLLGEAYGDGERVLLASSMPIRDAEAFLRGGPADVTFHANRGANGIDGLIATGSGIALASGEPTWVVLGDLALAHDLGGLAVAAAFDSPLRIVVIDNGGGGIFDFLPQAEQVESARFSRLFTTPSTLDLKRVAGLFDFPYLEVETTADLADVASHDRVLAHIRVDRSGNVALHRRIYAAVEAALSV